MNRDKHNLMNESSLNRLLYIIYICNIKYWEGWEAWEGYLILNIIGKKLKKRKNYFYSTK